MRTFEEGELLQGITLREWLSFAGVSLDSKNRQPWIRGGSLESAPYYRNTGIVLLVRMTYSNLRTWEFPSVGIGAPLVECAVEAVPLAWGFSGSEQYYDPVLGPVISDRTGIKVEFVTTGTVGTFSWFALILRFVEGVVLFGIADFLCDVTTEYIFHRDIYKTTILSHVTQGKIQESKRAAGLSKRNRTSGKAGDVGRAKAQESIHM